MKPEDMLEAAISAPARALDTAITESEVAMRTVFSKDPIKDAEAYWHSLGPGLTTGASDDDPAGIATYSQTGAMYGYQFLWLAVFTFPLMSVVQEMCARIGLATGKGLAGNIKKTYPKWVLYMVTGMLFFANTFNLGADLGALASAVRLIYPAVPFVVAIFIFTIISLGLIIFTTYSRYAGYLKYLALVLLLYVATALTLPGLDWKNILHNTLVPNILWTKDGALIICAILGTTISPYLFFWQTSQEVEERRLAGKIKSRLRHYSLTKKEVHTMRVDVWSGMFLSNLVMFFIILTCAATLFPNGITIATAEDAAAALKPLAGNQAYILFAMGIIGTGMLAIPVLAGSAAYALAESFHWKSGLYRKLRDAHGFYGVIIISMMLGLAMNFIGLNPIKALIYSAILNGLVAPVVLYFIVSISSDEAAMGKWQNRRLTSFIGWFIVGIMVISGIAAIAAIIL